MKQVLAELVKGICESEVDVEIGVLNQDEKIVQQGKWTMLVMQKP